MPAAQQALDDARAALANKLVEVKPQLETLFKPWTDALDKAIAATRKEAEPLLGGRPLEDVLTDVGLASKAQDVAAKTKPAASDLAKLVKDAKATTAATTTIRTKIAAARAYLDTKGTDEEKMSWSAKLTDLEGRAAKVVDRNTAAQSEAQVLAGSALALRRRPRLPSPRPGSPTGRRRSPPGRPTSTSGRPPRPRAKPRSRRRPAN